MAHICYGDGARGFDCIELQNFGNGGQPVAGDVDGDGDVDLVAKMEGNASLCRSQ